MAGYTKLFSDIILSTIWREDDKTRILWITMLAMRDFRHIVSASLPGLADMARISVTECEESLAKLEAPDPYSRSLEHEGRRIKRIDEGWVILNGEKYRNKMSSYADRTEYMRQKQAEHRAKLKVVDVNNVNTSCQTPVKQSESESESEKEKNKNKRAPTAPARTTKFTKPTPEEVTEYAKSIGYVLDGQRFCDSYEAKGWMIGKSKIKNWKAAVRVWKRNDNQQTARPQRMEHKPKPQELFETARVVCVEQFKMLIKSKGTPDDVERLSVKLKDQYRGILVMEIHGEKRFLIQESKEIARRQMGA